MPRFTFIRNIVAVFAMVVAALCGGGKAVAEDTGELVIVELRGDPALRSEAAKRPGDFLRKLLKDRYPHWFVRTKGGKITIWSPDGLGDALSELPSPKGVGFYEVAKTELSELREGRVPAGYEILPLRDDPDRLFAIKSTPLFDGSGIANASVVADSYGGPVVNFKFTSEASNVFGRWTQKSIGEAFAIVLDGEVVSAPIVRDPILGGTGQISGDFTLLEAERLAERLSVSLDSIDFVIVETCEAARPRAPPNRALAWLTPLPTCE